MICSKPKRDTKLVSTGTSCNESRRKGEIEVQAGCAEKPLKAAAQSGAERPRDESL